MQYFIPQGTIGHCFMIDENDFVSEAEFIVGDDMVFDDCDRVNSPMLINEYSRYILFNNDDMGKMILAVLKECVAFVQVHER